MRCRLLEYRPDFVRLVLEDTNPSLANAYRRAILSEVPVLAVDEVVFFANTTMFFDEYVAQRLAMTPIRMDKKVYSFGEEFTIRLKLDKTAQEDQEFAYSGELESTDPDIVPASDRIPIVAMNRGEKLSLEAIVRLGRGKKHTKWQAVSGLGYRYYPVYSFKEDACEEAKELVQELDIPAQRKGGWVRVEDAPLHPDLEGVLRDCGRTLGESAVVVEHDDNRIIIKFESTGALECGDVLLVAVDELQKKFESFEAALRESIAEAT